MPRKKNLTTAIGVVVDESGSMDIRAEETRVTFNKYFDDIEKEDSTATVTVATFSSYAPNVHKVRYLCKNTAVTDMPYLDKENYNPRGGTPLLDAVGETVSTLSKQDADRYLVVILTDGLENDSREYSYSNIQNLISSKEKTEKWTFVFLGAGVDAWNIAQSFGSSTPGTSFTYTGAAGTTSQTGQKLSASTRNYLGSAGTVAPDFFEPDKKKEKISS
jgi:hypothetical protein